MATGRRFRRTGFFSVFLTKKSSLGAVPENRGLGQHFDKEFEVVYA
jgi:hypothetical protein